MNKSMSKGVELFDEKLWTEAAWGRKLDFLLQNEGRDNALGNSKDDLVSEDDEFLFEGRW